MTHPPSIPRVRASAVCVALGHILVVRLEDPVSRAVFSVVPGGLVEPDESPAAAAEREVREETGLHVRVDPNRQRVERYPFTWSGQTFAVTTHFFAARLEPRLSSEAGVNSSPTLPEPILDSGLPAYHLATYWLALDRAEAELGFHPAIWAATRALISG
ncbi:MAG TPA: NUDIX domain-containing protein [Polyangiaceae bacterium]|nr:NUDIX domain-containing protein [Polyangiaceae bacterium]